MGIVRFALRWPYTFYVLALLILFLGVTAFRSMPTEIFPEIDIPVVTVIWQYTGLSTPEMEQRVTTYSEYALSTSVSGIEDIEAQTLDGISVQESRQFAEGLNRQRARAAGRRPRIGPRLERTPRDRTSIKHHPAIVPETDAESQPV